jgi:hypothetical protein
VKRASEAVADDEDGDLTITPESSADDELEVALVPQ